jgi:hypothetical protein
LANSKRGFLNSNSLLEYMLFHAAQLSQQIHANDGSEIMRANSALILALCCFGCARSSDAPPSESAALGSEPVAPTHVPTAKKYDGPFGLTAGLSIEEVRAAGTSLSPAEGEQGWFGADDVPTPHPDFETYFLHFSRKSGLCGISAIGKNIPTGDSGYEVRSAFEELAKAISAKYGKAKNYDFFSGAGSGDPQYWMMYLLQKDQTLAASWTKESGATLPESISAVFLKASATDTSTGFLSLKYEFSNQQDCADEGEAAKSEAL